MFHILAHAGEAHESAIESVAHSLAWYVQVPLFFVGAAFVAAVIWLITKRTDRTLMLTSFLLLVAGFALSGVAPIVALLSITTGLVVTLLVTLVGLGTTE